MSRSGYTIEGAQETAGALKKLGKDGKKSVRKAGKTVGDYVADKSRTKARGGEAMQRAAVRGLRGVGTLRGGAIRIQNTARVPYAMAAFLGVKGRRGWYANPRYDGGPDQFPEWVGQGWQPGGTGGPYHVNEVIRREGDHLIALYVDEIEQAASDLGVPFDN